MRLSDDVSFEFDANLSNIIISEPIKQLQRLSFALGFLLISHRSFS